MRNKLSLKELVRNEAKLGQAFKTVDKPLGDGWCPPLPPAKKSVVHNCIKLFLG